jgi:deoxyribodipyrimidine photo-lyase
VQERIRALNDAPVNSQAKYVLYWSRLNRRVDSNHALLHAVERANELGLPVLCHESLSCADKHASDRLHQFILEGVPEQARRLERLGVGYCFLLRRRDSEPEDVLDRLAQEAGCVVSDDYPASVAAESNADAASGIKVRHEAVDSSCVVPMRLLQKREYAAYTIRPKIRRLLPQYLQPCPVPRVAERWRQPLPEWHTRVTEAAIPALLAGCEIDHSVAPSIGYTGGRRAAEKLLAHFLDENLRRYARERNEPAAHATSNLSPYLHCGQISSLEIALAVRRHAEQNQLIADEYLDELIVRRELAFNYALHVASPACLANLPDWAKETLRKHAQDRREPAYGYEQFAAAQTHDELWNACQREMLLRGKIHGYYRMYWGKKIIEWSRTCQDALETMLRIHDRYALDGRDPNTYTNILWCFGLHDRPWPSRRIFGSVRYMSYEGMRRKTGVDDYIQEISQLERTRRDPFRIG